MANITPKSNGTHLIRISCGSDSSGKPIIRSKIFKPSNPKLREMNKPIFRLLAHIRSLAEFFG